MKSRKPQSYHGILFAVLLAGIAGSLGLYYGGTRFLSASRAWGNKAQENKVEPSYYKEEAFTRPQFLPTPQAATVSAQKIPIIMYHYVEYVKDTRDAMRIRLSTPPHVFEETLASLKRDGFETYFMKDVNDLIDSRMYLAKRAVVLTFDDGYADFYDVVYPLLRKYHMRATVYVIHDFIGKKDFLTREQIRELIDSGLVEIGSHTLSHPYLKSVDNETARREIFDSKLLLEQEFGISIGSFAYPYGAMSPESVAYAKEAGYGNAVSVISGSIQSGDNRYFLSRIRPEMFTPSSVTQVIEGLRK